MRKTTVDTFSRALAALIAALLALRIGLAASEPDTAPPAGESPANAD